MLKIALLSLLAIVPTTCLYALVDFDLEHLSSDSGIEFVNNLHRDSKGYLWATTNTQGLARFDGRSTKWYRHDENDPSSISTNRTSSAAESTDGSIWVATHDGLNRLVKDQDEFIHYKNDPSNPRSLADNFVLGIISLADGKLWVLSRTCLQLYEPKTDDFTRFDLPEEFEKQDRFSYMVKAADGTLWMTSSLPGLLAFNPQSRAYSYHHSPKIKTNDHWRRRLDFAPDQTEIWLTLGRSGLASFNIKEARFTHYAVDPSRSGKGPPNNHPNDVLHLDAETVVISYDQGGICFYDKSKKRFSYQDKDSAQTTDIISDGIYTLYKDYEGIVWVGTTRAGIYYSNPDRYKFLTYTPSSKYGRPKLSGHLVGCVFEDTNGGIWISTDGSGINYLNRKTNQITVYDTQNSQLESGTIRNMTEDSDGTIWAATWDAGLYRYDQAINDFERVELPEAMTSLFGRHGIWRVEIDSKKRFWITSGPRLFVLNKDFVLLKQFNFHDTEYVNNSRIFPYQNFVLNTNNYGATIIDNDTLETRRLFEDQAIVDMVRDAEDNFYFATAYSGILVYGPDLNYLRTIYSDDKYPKGILRSLQIGNDDAIWASSESGLYRIQLDSDHITRFDK